MRGTDEHFALMALPADQRPGICPACGPWIVTITAQRLARGVWPRLGALGYAALAEFPLNSGRRVDVIASQWRRRNRDRGDQDSTADYRADRKWNEYLESRRLLLRGPGRLSARPAAGRLRTQIADDYGAEILRRAVTQPMNAAAAAPRPCASRSRHAAPGPHGRSGIRI